MPTKKEKTEKPSAKGGGAKTFTSIKVEPDVPRLLQLLKHKMAGKEGRTDIRNISAAIRALIGEKYPDIITESGG